MKSHQKNHHLIFLGMVVLIVVAFLFRHQLSEFKQLGLFGIFLINFLGNATVFLPAPAIATVFVGGALYPVALVAVVSGLGASFGDMVGFFLGHFGKHVLFKGKEHVFYVLLKSHFHRFGPLIIFVFAFIPNPFFDAVGILAGMFGYSAYRFFVIMFVGRVLRGLLLASLGSQFR